MITAILILICACLLDWFRALLIFLVLTLLLLFIPMYYFEPTRVLLETMQPHLINLLANLP